MPHQRTDGPREDDETGSSPDRHLEGKRFIGGYYWFPIPDADGVAWTVVTCRELGCGPDAGHDAELWPKLIARLAAAWGKDAKLLQRQLGQTYTGLPRGRVTRPEKAFLILHGNDSPVSDWLELVIESFGLTGRRVKILFDEHETRIDGHPRVVEESLGLRLSGAEI